MKTCAQCGQLIADPDAAFYDSELQEWFCSHSCYGKYQANLTGDVPA